MNALIRSPRGGLWLSVMAISGVIVFGLAIGVLMAPYQAALGDRLPDMQCLQVAFTPARASSVIMSFTPEAQAAMAGLLIPGDLGLAWGYGLLLAGMVGLLARRLDGAWQRAGAIAMWFPIAASVFDCIEDVFLYSMVTAQIDNPGVDLSPMLPLFASLSATLKYTALSVLTPVFSIAGVIQGIRSNRRIGALIVYALVLLTTLMFSIPPLRNLPGCF
jgi:hypothetical protein